MRCLDDNGVRELASPEQHSRIISVILFVMATGYLRQTFSDPNTVPTLIIAVVIWLVGLAVTVLLFTKTIQTVFNRTVQIASRLRSTPSRTS
jgi:uncharacterized membrane protein